MRGKSHITLGKYLLRQYFPNLPKAYRRAFLLGCIEPDRNPVTYLKGSIRCQWLRGHNYQNAHRFMSRIARRLECKKQMHFFDYYTLGKLIHYTADAFTFAHNDFFPDNISGHRSYEAALQDYFIPYLKNEPKISLCPSHSIMDSIRLYHKEYSSVHTDIHRDSRFALHACCCVLATLVMPRVI